LAVKKLLLLASLAGLVLAAAGGAGARSAAAPEHLFVGFTKTPGAAERALVQRYGGTVRFSFSAVDALAVDLDQGKVGDLAREAGVAYVEQDPVRTPSGLSDLETSQLTPALSNGLYGLVTTDAVGAHSSGYRGSGVKACVADSAIDTGHPDIAANFQAGYNAVDGNNTVDVFSLGVAKTETHATHVAGTLLGVDNSQGIIGVAPQADLYLARVLSTQSDGSVSGLTSEIMDGVQWLADQGCQVINLSLGGGVRSRTEEAFYDQIIADGTVVVAAAGNEGRKTIDYPAAYPAVLSVGAVDRNNEHASFSNTGKGLDLSAPGVDVLSSVPNGQGRDSSVVSGTTTFEAFGFEFADTTSSSGITDPLVDCGYAATAADCGTPSGDFIALIERGKARGRSITFAQKVANAMDAGAVGAIIYNNETGNFQGTLGTADNDGTPWIPAVSVSDTDGATLLGEAGNSVTLVNAGTRWDYFSGTSMATPHVAGVAALVLGKDPSLTPTEVESILTESADDLGASGYDKTFGYGLVDATGALAATP
jgi:serine protease